jgi:two-component system, chemotaxis family, sensor kinase CheA
MNMKHLYAMFLQECVDHLRALDTWGAQTEAQATTPSEIDAAFRAIHSIKGGAGMFGFERVLPLAHAYETLLDGMREGTLALSSDTMATVVKATDCLADLVEAEQKGIVLPPNYETVVTQSMSRLAGLDGLEAADGLSESQESGRGLEVAERRVLVKFLPRKQLLRRACEPLHVIRQLMDMGSLSVSVDLSGMPDFTTHDPSDAWMGWHLSLITTRPLAAVTAAFEFVSDDADVAVSEQQGVVADTAAEPSIPSTTVPPAENHVAVPVSQDARNSPPAEPFAFAEVPRALPVAGNDLIEKQVEQALTFKQRASDHSDTSSIRVDVSRIDRLVNLAGEIAISQAMVAQLIDQSLFTANPQLFQELSQLLVHTQNLQESVMAIRAQPVRTVFERMPRLVRDLAAQLGKDISLRLSGEATEIDKTVIEQLSDPIMHMLRNSCDHGIEPPADRLASGKPPTGSIVLHAEQRGSNIVIEISDDGKGLNRAQILERAIARSIISTGANLQPEDIDNLIFLPGFSTAEKVTAISGRGVGMDVVRRNVQKFGGKVSIRSQQGKGSVITLTLPLTLAVLEGMILRCGTENFVIPVNHIQECRANWQEDTGYVPGTGHVLNFRGRHIAVHDLRDLFATAGGRTGTSTAIIAEIENNNLAAFVADEIVGQQQVVIKNIAAHTEPVKGIAGATILGDGRVALILDPGEIVKIRQEKTLEQNDRRHVA